MRREERLAMRVRRPLPSALLGVTSLCLGFAACTGSSGKAPDKAAPASTTTTTTAADAAVPAADQPVSGSIEVYDQDSDGTSLVVKRTTITGAPGWVVVHMDDGGPETVIGCTAIPEGTAADVVVKLTTKVGTSAVWPMLHRDAGQPGVCEWPGGPDGPVRPPTGAITYATRKIMLTVP